MSSDLLSRLQGAVGTTYRIERELGGGGMSRVFLAEEVDLGRKVVIKVLPPEMGAGVNVDRFRREIQLAAKLQHPHIVPLLTAGASGDLLYYIMPFIQGESLRAKLAREGELPVLEVLRILKEVLDALAHAHEQGVVHRDIKPDNVLLSGKHALVTDFGVAKAVSESTGGSHLTSLGVALGTPTYMSPEQAAADPHVDHRADIYAVGAMAYEMLCGRPPFTGTNVQALLSAHITQAPDPVTRYRETVPAALNELILRCLAKKAADRWQRAEDLIPQVDALLTPSGGVTPSSTQPVQAVGADRTGRMETDKTYEGVERAGSMRVAALFSASSLIVLFIVYFIVQFAGLPDWVFYAAIALLAAGLPIMLLTGRKEQQRAIATLTGMSVATPVGLQRHFTWRKSLIGGGLAFAGLAITAGGYTAMREMGIGPVGTLVASGALGAQDRLVVADFVNRTSDATLGPSVTEALRIDLAQSPVVRLLQGSTIAEALQRMGRDAGAGLDPTVAREVAVRENAKAVVEGEIAPLGSGFVLSARVVPATGGEALVALRETAADQAAIIAAVDRLSGKLRERIGESLKTIRAGTPLEQVTTSSLEALRRYSEAERASDVSDYARAAQLLEEAIALDSTFAMAYRKLAVVYGNTGAGFSLELATSRRAFELRDRLPVKERYLAEAYYYGNVESDPERVIVAYRRVLEVYPDDPAALNNGALQLLLLRRYAEAEPMFLRAAATSQTGVAYMNAMRAQVLQGKIPAAESTLVAFERDLPGNPEILHFRGLIAGAERRYGDAARAFDSMRVVHRSNAFARRNAANDLATTARVQGRLADAERWERDVMALEEERGAAGAALVSALDIARDFLRLRGEPDRAVRIVDETLRRLPLARMDPADRPYSELAGLLAEAGQVERAKRLMAEYDTNVEEPIRNVDFGRHLARGRIAMAEKRWQDAVVAFRTFHESPIPGAVAGLFELAQAHDAAGDADSARALYARVADTPRFYPDNGPALKRLGELYEQLGDREKAVEYYGRLVELWKGADPELQSVLTEVKQRMARLVGEGR